jgi:hypothetical protein
MSILGKVVAGGAKEIIEAGGEVAEIFVANRTKREAIDADTRRATMEQFAAEFLARPPQTWWDSFVDGWNRVPRPLMATMVVGMMAWTVYDPLAATAAWMALETIPEGGWWFILTVTAFYFGGRAISPSARMTRRTPEMTAAALEAVRHLRQAEDDARRSGEIIDRADEIEREMDDLRRAREAAEAADEQEPAAPPETQPAPAPGVPARPGWLRDLTRPHKHPIATQVWTLTADGVEVGMAPAARTPGEPTTVRRIWRDHGPKIARAAREYGVPVELIIATIATESGGKVPAKRRDESRGRWSHGVMQVLNTTAADMLGVPVAEITEGQLIDDSVDLGTRYIAQQFRVTSFDPPLTLAAYNAGSLRASGNSRWGLVSTGDHIDRGIRWFNDAMQAGIGYPEDLPSFRRWLA